MAKAKNTLEFRSGIVTAVLAAAALVLFFLSYSTGYYTFGQMQSSIIASLMGVGLAIAVAALFLRSKMPKALWVKILTFCVTALLAAAAILLLGDRVEGIGNCILTDYDSGHGGEEAIYMSLGAVILLLIAVVFNVIGSFDSGRESGKGGKIALYAVGCVLLLAVLIPSLSMGGLLGRSAQTAAPVSGDATSAPAGDASGAVQNTAGGTYTISYNQGNGNVDDMPGYQFLCSDLSGMLRADSRFYIDETLELDGSGGYKLNVDSYVFEGGKRAELGDDTGLGLVLTTAAEGAYTDNGDGTVTIHRPDHAVFEMETDTYSSQMKGAAQMNVNGNDADGVYDSNDEPAVLDFVPETVFTLSDGKIVSYREPAGGTYTISYNQGNGNVDDMPGYQFLCSDLSGMVRADSRFYIDETLELDGNGGYKLNVDSYVVEGGKRAEVGDDTGLGLVLTTVAEGSYVENEDGTVTIHRPDHAVFEMETDTYSSQMKGAAQMNVNGNDADGVYDSNDEPAVLDFVPETVFTLSGSEIVSYREAGASGQFTVSFNQGNENVDDMPGYQFLCSDLSGMVRADSRFYIDAALELDGSGGYKLSVDSYVIEGGKRAEVGDDTGLGLVLTTVAEGSYVENEDGTVTTYKADHAVFEMETDTYSAQMKGAAQMKVNGNDADGVYDSNDEPAVLDFVPETVWTLDKGAKAIVTWSEAAAAEEAEAEAAAKPAEEVSGVEILSDDGATRIVFYPTGTYEFCFDQHNISDPGHYEYVDGVLKLTDANGVETIVEGDPLLLHYVSAVSDQLTGDFTIPAEALAFQAAESIEAEAEPEEAADAAADAAAEPAEEVNGAEILSDDGATRIVFYPTGTYEFCFDQYGVSDPGHYEFVDGVLTLTDANGTETSVEGDPMLLHYVSAVSDQLTGDFTIPAASLAFQAAESVEAAAEDAGITGQFTVSFNQGNENVDDMPGYQFLCSDLSGMLRADSRFFIDETLELDGNGGYRLSVDSYVVEAGKRTEIGDDTGLGMVLTTVAEGSYVENEDGTVTTFKADHTVFEMKTDTYSSQIKAATQMNVNGSDADGVYDSDDEPAVLDFVPETVWTLDESTMAIVSWRAAETAESIDAEAEPEEAADAAADAAAEPAEEVNGAEIASDDGATRIVFYPTGTYEFCFDQYGVSDPGHYEYVDGVLTLTDANGAETSVEGDPMLLHYVSALSDQLTGDFTIPAEALAFQAAEIEEAAEAVAELEEATAAAEEEKLIGITLVSDDHGTTLTLKSDGTYRFWFAPYEVEDLGAWQIADGVLTLTDTNGVETSAEGNPYRLHYVYSQNEGLTGDFTVSADVFPFPVSALSVPSDDLGTTMTFFADGSYCFAFGDYGVTDPGTYVFEDGVLTLTDANGKETAAEGETLALHYVYSQNDALTGDFTIDPAALVFPEEESEEEALHGITLLSDDRGTTLTLNGDGTYRFWFAPYEVEDLGAWQIADGILSLTDANGKEIAAEGAPYKLHYVYSQNEGLTGDYTIPVCIFPFPVSGVNVPSDDLGTNMTFFADGSYIFSFDAYSVMDVGTYVFEDGVLTLTDANGRETAAEGETLALHYVYSQNDALTGDFTIDPAVFG